MAQPIYRIFFGFFVSLGKHFSVHANGTRMDESNGSTADYISLDRCAAVCLQAGTTHGTVQKKLSVREETCYRGLMKDEMMRHLVPQYYDTITLDDDERETLTIMA